MAPRGTALITGAAKRLGRHLALDLAARGWRVVINYRNSAAAAQELVAEVMDAGGQARAIQADISDSQAVAAMVAEVQQQEGQLNLLINNVGNYHPGPATELSCADWDACIDANLSGSFYTCHHALPLLRASGGQIINIGYAGLALNPATPGALAYQVSKVGLLSLTRSLAVALAPDIRVNMISPGQLEDSIDLPPDLTAAIPMERAGTHRDIAAAVHFLLAASYVTGQNLDVAGGYRLEAS